MAIYFTNPQNHPVTLSIEGTTFTEIEQLRDANQANSHPVIDIQNQKSDNVLTIKNVKVRGNVLNYPVLKCNLDRMTMSKVTIS